jgi:hypothetical protein
MQAGAPKQCVYGDQYEVHADASGQNPSQIAPSWRKKRVA